MKRLTDIFKSIYIRTTGYSYTNMGRLFLRLFVGIMLMQFGIRQIMNFPEMAELFPALPGISPETSLTIMTVIDIVCSLFIMLGLLTRLMTLPPFIAMIIAECHTLDSSAMPSYMLTWTSAGYLPIMFMGIYFFLMLVGPGKISLDYFISLHFIHSADKSETELEEV